VAETACPTEDPRFELLQLPLPFVLQAVVVAAERSQIRNVGSAALRMIDGVIDV
jgi:hypothetical protein